MLRGTDPDVAYDHEVTAARRAEPEHEHEEWDEHDDSYLDDTGGLEVIGAGETHETRRGRGGGGGGRGGGGGGGRGRGGDDGEPGRRRRGRRPIAIVVSLLVLAGLVVGVVVGGRALLGEINPTAADYTGAGTGSVEIRISNGDSLRTIGTTLAEADVIASVAPFTEAAAANPAATSIQPGVYAMRQQMSGQAALDLLLTPSSRLRSRVTIQEGLTVAQTLQRLSDGTQTPLADLQAAAADPSQLGLPAWANNQLEGFLYPLTYDFEPGTAPVDILRTVVAGFTENAARLQIEQRAAAAGRSPYDVVVIASMIQSETQQDAERPLVAEVIYNRIAQGIPLGIDATVAYGLGKNGNDLTRADLAAPGPYNSRINTGLPPTPISSPGEASLDAAMSPATGDLLFYVLQSADGTHFFTNNLQDFEAARQRCADAGLGCGPG